MGRKGWHRESGRHSLARRGLTKTVVLKDVRHVIDKDLSDNIDAMRKAASAAGRDDLTKVYDDLERNQSEPQLVYEEKVVPKKGILARHGRKKAKEQQADSARKSRVL